LSHSVESCRVGVALSDMTSLMGSLMSLELVWGSHCGDLYEANRGIDEVDVIFLGEIERVATKLLWEFDEVDKT